LRCRFALDCYWRSIERLEALDVLENATVDIVLLDIRMPEMDGIELAEHLQKFPRHCGDLHHCLRRLSLKAFEVNAIDYLLKPIRRTSAGRAEKAKMLTPDSVQNLREAADKPRPFKCV